MKPPGATRVTPPVTRVARAPVATALVVGTVAEVPPLARPQPLKDASPFRVARMTSRRADASGAPAAGVVRRPTGARSPVARGTPKGDEAAALVGPRATRVRRVVTGRAQTQRRARTVVGRKRRTGRPQRRIALVGADRPSPGGRPAAAACEGAEAGVTPPVPEPFIPAPLPGARTAAGGAAGGAVVKMGVGDTGLPRPNATAAATALGPLRTAVVAAYQGGLGSRLGRAPPRPVAVARPPRKTSPPDQERPVGQDG